MVALRLRGERLVTEHNQAALLCRPGSVSGSALACRLHRLSGQNEVAVGRLRAARVPHRCVCHAALDERGELRGSLVGRSMIPRRGSAAANTEASAPCAASAAALVACCAASVVNFPASAEGGEQLRNSSAGVVRE